MILRAVALLVLLFFQQNVSAQADLSVQAIPENLKESANAVIRLDQTDIVIESQRSMTVKTRRIVTVLNEKGLGKMNAIEHYDGSTRVKSVEVVIYNASGSEIKKIKKKDFIDHSVSEAAVLSDNRVLYLDYTPVQYPFTMVYTSEVETSNTAFIPKWSPVDSYYASTEKSMVKVTYKKELGFRYKNYNEADIQFAKEEKDNSVMFSAENIPAYKEEDYSPSFHKIAPQVLFSLTKFHLEGVDGEAKNWEEFGRWYNTLLVGTDELPEATIAKIKALVGKESDPLKKAKIVYEYVQGKTRYILVALGIGGWKPMKAKDVDRLGYGDCKALSNYTRALLKAVGVESYCAVIYAGDKRDITPDFTSMQGNHMILGVPANGTITWLECTSQTLPFGFQGKFTDDRLALLVKPEKGELVRTKVFETPGNTQFCKGSYQITETGDIKGSIIFTSRGTQYDSRYSLEGIPVDDLLKSYRSRFNNINNIKFSKATVKNNKEAQEFIEDLVLEASGYASKTGNRLMFSVNAFNKLSGVPQRYRSRKTSFNIERGWLDADEIIVEIPAGYSIEAKPENITLKEKYGEYKTEYIEDGPNRILFKRTIQLNEGSFASSDYESYRAFREKIARNDNAKIVLVKNQ